MRRCSKIATVLLVATRAYDFAATNAIERFVVEEIAAARVTRYAE